MHAFHDRKAHSAWTLSMVEVASQESVLVCTMGSTKCLSFTTDLKYRWQLWYSHLAFGGLAQPYDVVLENFTAQCSLGLTQQ